MLLKMYFWHKKAKFFESKLVIICLRIPRDSRAYICIS